MILTEKYKAKPGDPHTVHPDCNTTLLDCSRCGCPAESHEVDAVETARERGHDALALQQTDDAIGCYTEAIESSHGVDWRLFSNRSLCYLRKRWYAQALIDAEKACALNPGEFKVWYRQAAALSGLGKYEKGLGALARGKACLIEGCQEKEKISENLKAIRVLEADIRGKWHGSRMDQGEKRRTPAGNLVNLMNKDQTGLTKEKKEKSPIKKGVNNTAKMKGLYNDTNDTWDFQALSLSLSSLERAVDMLLECQQQQNTRLGRIEDALESLLEGGIRESGLRENGDVSLRKHCTFEDEIKGFDRDSLLSLEEDDLISETCSDLSDLSETIDMIQRAWQAKLSENSQEYGGQVKPARSEEFVTQGGDEGVSPGQEHRTDSISTSTDECNVPGSPTLSSGYTSRRSTQEIQERMSRVAAAQLKIKEAADAGEVLMETNLDMLSQQKRTSCTSCSECSGFRIFYCSTDVHDPEIMFYCSTCGCASESHLIDSIYAREEEERRHREEHEARVRSDRMKSRQLHSDSSSKTQMAYATLGLRVGSSKPDIRQAFKRLAKLYHPDKSHGASGDISYRQDMFAKVTNAYKLLME
jgi:tetratricopeptide (TPR) repeat protein